MVTASCGFADPDSLYWAGPTISVEVGFDPAFNPRDPVRPTLPSTPWSGLVDTGAMDCCIDSEVAQLLDLPIVDQGFISGAGGSVQVNRHLAQLYIPGLNYTMYGSFAGVHLVSGGQPHQVLIGRSLLRAFRLEYNGRTGEVLLRRDP